MKRLALAVVCLLAVGAIFLALHERDAPEPFGIDDDVDPASLDVPPPSLVGVGPASRASRANAGANSEVEAEMTGEVVAPTPSHRVEGSIEGLTAEALAATVVRVHLLGSYDWVNTSQSPASATPDADGRFRVDVGTLRRSVPNADRVQVSVDHPAFLVARVKLELAPLEAGVTVVADPFHLKQAARIPVVVQDPDGKAVAGADVVLLRMEGDAPARNAAGEAIVLDAGTSDEVGEIVLRTAAEGIALLAADHYPHLPASERLLLDGGDLTPRVLALGRGASITGRVTVNGASIGPASLRTSPRPFGEGLDLGGIWVAWLDGRFVPASSSVTSDAHGHFEVRGLRPGTQVLTVQGFAGARSQLGEGWNGSVEVEAPAQGVLIDVVAAVVAIRVVSNATPVEGASVMVGTDGKGFSGAVTEEDGVLRFLLRPETSFVVRVSHEDFAEERDLPLPVLAAGDVRDLTVDLGPPRSQGTLIVVLRDAEGAPVTKAGFRLVEDGNDGLGFFDDGLGERTAEHGVFRLEGVWAGPATLVVTPGRGPEEYRGDYLLLTEPVDVPADREVRVELTATRGARVTLLVTDEAGTPLDATATLRDGRGEEVRVVYFASDEFSASLSDGGPGPQRTTLEPPLAPGTYEIECSVTGYESRRTSFVVEAGTDPSWTVSLTKE